MPRVPSDSTIIGGLLVAAVLALPFLLRSEPSDRERVEAYCAYTAKSAAQWLGCVEHATIGKVRAMATPAARFALNEGTCPRSTFCERWQELRSYCSDAAPRHIARCVAARAAEARGSYDSGSYDSGSYDSGSYDSGSYDSGSYDSVPTTAAPTTAAPTDRSRPLAPRAYVRPVKASGPN